MRVKRKLFACGCVLTAMIILSVSLSAYGMVLLESIPLVHHHTQDCLGEKVRFQEADGEASLLTINEYVCPDCGGMVNDYRFIATCSCGQKWERYGHACFNSPFGSNPEGGCSNYNEIDFDTGHDHVYTDYICGKEEGETFGNLNVMISGKEPAREVVLSAAFEGDLKDASYAWEGSEDSSITVTGNGNYKIISIYSDMGKKVEVSKSVTVSNIDRENPEVKLVMEPEDWEGGACTVRVVATDVGLGLADEPYSFDGGETWSANGEIILYDTTEVEVMVRDKAGNTAGSSLKAVNQEAERMRKEEEERKRKEEEERKRKEEEERKRKEEEERKRKEEEERKRKEEEERKRKEEEERKRREEEERKRKEEEERKRKEEEAKKKAEEEAKKKAEEEAKKKAEEEAKKKAEEEAKKKAEEEAKKKAEEEEKKKAEEEAKKKAEEEAKKKAEEEAKKKAEEEAKKKAEEEAKKKAEEEAKKKAEEEAKKKAEEEAKKKAEEEAKKKTEEEKKRKAEEEKRKKAEEEAKKKAEEEAKKKAEEEAKRKLILKGIPVKMLEIKEFVDNLPREVKVVTVSATSIIGVVGIVYALYILLGTAKIFWIDSEGRKHYLARIPIRRGSRGYIIRIDEDTLESAESGELSIDIPGNFERLHRYQPVQIRYKDNMFSLHIEKDIKVKV